MSWVPPAAKNAVKYAPYVREAWKHVGKPTKEAAGRALEQRQALRYALAHAETLDNGSVLEGFDPGTQGKVFIVCQGEQAIEAYPTPSRSLEDVLRGVDLSRRRTPEEMRAQRRERSARERARRIAHKRRLAKKSRSMSAEKPPPDPNLPDGVSSSDG